MGENHGESIKSRDRNLQVFSSLLSLACSLDNKSVDVNYPDLLYWFLTRRPGQNVPFAQCQHLNTLYIVHLGCPYISFPCSCFLVLLGHSSAQKKWETPLRVGGSHCRICRGWQSFLIVGTCYSQDFWHIISAFMCRYTGIIITSEMGWSSKPTNMVCQMVNWTSLVWGNVSVIGGLSCGKKGALHDKDRFQKLGEKPATCAHNK